MRPVNQIRRLRRRLRQLPRQLQQPRLLLPVYLMHTHQYPETQRPVPAPLVKRWLLVMGRVHTKAHPTPRYLPWQRSARHRCPLHPMQVWMQQRVPPPPLRGMTCLAVLPRLQRLMRLRLLLQGQRLLLLREAHVTGGAHPSRGVHQSLLCPPPIGAVSAGFTCENQIREQYPRSTSTRRTYRCSSRRVAATVYLGRAVTALLVVPPVRVVWLVLCLVPVRCHR